MTERWPGLRRIADELYDICEDGGFDKTAAEVQSEMHVRLLGALRRLLELLERAEGNPPWDDLHTDIEKELTKWRR